MSVRSPNAGVVAGIYEAFGRGDISAILDHLADDVHWEAWADNQAQRAGVPWLRPRNGKQGVREFFEIVATFKISEFKVLSLMEGDHQVAAEILIDAEVPPPGGAFRDEELHLWSFDDRGKIVRMRHYVDTAKHTRAAGLMPLEQAASGAGLERT
jgi:uncharacterized protein